MRGLLNMQNDSYILQPRRIKTPIENGTQKYTNWNLWHFKDKPILLQRSVKLAGARAKVISPKLLKAKLVDFVSTYDYSPECMENAKQIMDSKKLADHNPFSKWVLVDYFNHPVL